MKHLLILGCALLAVHGALAETAPYSDIYEDAYDVVVVGGTSAGVAAALAAHEAGARVFLVAPRSYLGEDLAGKYRLVPEAGDDASHPLYAGLWTSIRNPGEAAKPLAIKKHLDRALLDAKIPFRTWTPTVDVAKDAAGHLAGVVVWNRNGRRTVRAKAIVDATERAQIARAAGCTFAPFPSANYTFIRYVVSSEQPKAPGMVVKAVASTGTVRIQKRQQKGDPAKVQGTLWACQLSLPMKDGSALAFAAAEQLARDATWTYQHLEAADTLVMPSPPDRVKTVVEGVYVAGPLADVAYRAPGSALTAAAQLGAAAAKWAVSRPEPRPEPAAEHDLPVVATCDVAIAGLGTGGAPALIAAARRGAKAMGFEWSYKCGGLTTDGMINGYWYGNRVGFTSEIDAGVAHNGLVAVAAKEQWFRSEARRAGATIVFGAFVADVVTDEDRLAGVVVVFSDGSMGLVRCRAAVDATGNADLAAAAGNPTEFIDSSELALQGAAFIRKSLGASSQNIDYAFINDTDADDLWYISLRGRALYQSNFWDQAQVIATRERRRILGIARVSPQDVMLGRTYPDTVCVTRSNFDTHGQTVDPQFFIEPPPHVPVFVNLPYRALQPAKTDNLLVIGLGLSAHRDAMPILRMEPDVQNQGYVAGTAAALALQTGRTTRTLEVKELQKILIAKGVVPPTVLTAQDSFPLSDARIDEAVRTLPDQYTGLAVVFAEPKRVLPRLDAAYDAACKAESVEARLVYAHVLAFLGDARGAADLAAKVKGASWDQGWDWRGMGQFGRSVSWLDSYIIALGRTRAACAFEAIAARAKELEPTDLYSHFRAVALAFESLGDARAVPILAALLAKPGIGGHAFDFARDGVPLMPNYDVYNFSGQHAVKGRGLNAVPDRERAACLRELCLARALWRLGDADGLGAAALKAYAADPRRAYAEHAKKVLEAGRITK